MATLFSFEFLTGFLLFFIVYWLLVPWVKIQNVMLLIAGYLFVGSVGFYSLCVLLSWSFCVCVLVAIASHEKYRHKSGLALSFILVGYFIVFKYYMPISDWLLPVLQAHGIQVSQPVIAILLPLGLSFYLFNSVSLVLSVARGEISPPALLIRCYILILFRRLLPGR